MNTAPDFPCPHCEGQVRLGTPACPSCGLRLVGPDAARLWQVNQQIQGLRAEADHLLTRLREPVPAGVGSPGWQLPGQAATAGPPPPYAPYPLPAAHAAPRKPLSGQQVLLGLGALLLLSGASFFLLVVWFLVGLIGQAVIMLGLTGASAAACSAATKRRMPAAAETFAVIASGLVLIDLWAAHGLNLAGLGELRADRYWVGAGLLGGALLLGFDRLTPRAAAGAPLRPVWTYRPAAAVLFTAAATNLVAALDPDRLAFCALAAGLAALCVLGAVLAGRLDRPFPTAQVDGVLVPGRSGLGRTGSLSRVPWSAVPPAVVAGCAVLAHLAMGAAVGYDPASSGQDRYAALALLLIVPAIALVLRQVAPAGVPAGVRGSLGDLALLTALPACGIALVDADRWVLVGVAVVVAVALVADIVLRGTRLSVAGVAGWVLLPLLSFAVLLLVDEAAADCLALFAGRSGSPAPWWLPVLPALAWTLASLAAAVRTRLVGWMVLTQVAVGITLFMLVRDAETVVAVVVLLVACAASLALAAVARSLPATSDHDLLDGTALAFAAAYAASAIVLSVDGTPYLLAASLALTGASTLAYSASRERLPVAYLGSLLVTAATTVLWHETGVEVVEAYTAPLVLLLAAIGWVQWSRNPASPTMLTMGPAIGAALLPSTMVAIESSQGLRLAVVTLAAIAVLVVGLVRHLRAPVTVAAVSLVLVAITQGGPQLQHVPGFITLIGAGALLLAIGVAWERAVLAGRRTASWYATLR